MPYDAEFQRLLDARDTAFERKQAAWQVQDRAWNELQQTRERCGAQLDALKAQRDAAYAEVGAAFERSRQAFGMRNHEAAQQYSAEGKSRKAALDASLPAYRSQRGALFDQIKAASARQRAARDDFRAAKAAHERAQAAFSDYCRRSKIARQYDNAAVAAEAGVPAQYHDNVYVSVDPEGNRQIYFGGAGGDPLGDGHGHYVLDRGGRVIYRREPNQERGPQNFTDYQPAKERPAPKPTPPRQQPEPPRESPRPPRQQSRPAAPVGSKWEPSRDRDERVRREQAAQAARQAAEAAADKKRREEDTPRIAAQAAADAQTQAAQRAAHYNPDGTPTRAYYLDAAAQLLAAATGDSSYLELRTPVEEDRKLTDHFRPTPDADPSPPARVGSGKKWEPEADRLRREKREAAERRGMGVDHKWSRSRSSGGMTREELDARADEVEAAEREPRITRLKDGIRTAQDLQEAARANRDWRELERQQHVEEGLQDELRFLRAKE